MASPKKSGKTRHSYVQFYPSDWLAGTARMPRLVKSVYHDICLYNWDKAEPVPESELMLMLSDIPEQGDAIVNALVKSKKLFRDSEGGTFCQRAMDEAQRSLDMWTAKSKGGKNKPQTKEKDGKNEARDLQESCEESSLTLPIEPEPEPEPDDSSNEESDSPPSGVVNSPCEIDPPEPTAKPKSDRITNAENAGAVLDAWNDMARAAGLSQVVKMVGERPAHLKARIKDHGLETLIDAIRTIPDHPFLMGKNDRNWIANFDWLMRPAACAKLIEGGYAQGEGIGSAWRD